MTVLDASAVLALLHDEPGADMVMAALPGSVLGAANLAEVIGKLVDEDVDSARLRELLGAAGVRVEPVTEADAESPEPCVASPAVVRCPSGTAAALPWRYAAIRRGSSTADRVWADLHVPVHGTRSG